MTEAEVVCFLEYAEPEAVQRAHQAQINAMLYWPREGCGRKSCMLAAAAAVELAIICTPGWETLIGRVGS